MNELPELKIEFPDMQKWMRETEAEVKSRIKIMEFNIGDLTKLPYEELDEKYIKLQNDYIDNQDFFHAREIELAEYKIQSLEIVVKLVEYKDICHEAIVELEKKCATYLKKKSANDGHDQKDGSRDKRKKIIAVFATGKYKNNKTKCAEEEHNKFFMSLSTARKALIGIPNPDPALIAAFISTPDPT